MDGGTKIKGGQLVRGIAPAGAFNINNNATIVAQAILDYFVNDTPVETTINECQDILAFQLVAKVSSKYTNAFHIVNGEKVPIQRCNRVYASPDMRHGRILHSLAWVIKHRQTDLKTKKPPLPLLRRRKLHLLPLLKPQLRRNLLLLLRPAKRWTWLPFWVGNEREQVTT